MAGGERVKDAVLAERSAAVTPEDIADIMFTSGTTGLPKGAIFDHKRTLGGARAWRTIASMTADDRYCVFGPFSHNASYKAGWVVGLMTGSTIYCPDAYDGASVLDLIAKNRVTVMPAPLPCGRRCFRIQTGMIGISAPCVSSAPGRQPSRLS
jgi:HIP---CoA ligase